MVGACTLLIPNSEFRIPNSFGHPNKDAHWIVNRYWLVDQGEGWVFATRKEGKAKMRLKKHSETPIVRHTKVQGERSPYDGDWIYWSSRMGKHPETDTRTATLLKRQKGKCALCGLFFKDGDLLETDHITPKKKGGKDTYDNLQLLHRHCHDTKTANDGSPGTQSGCNSTEPKPTETEIPIGRGDILAPLKRIVKEVGKWVMRWA